MSATYERGFFFRGPATRLSEPSGERNEPPVVGGAAKRALRFGPRLARFSLLVLPMTCAAGCFDAPPTYSEPTLVPPVIFADQCSPPTTHLVNASFMGDAKFTVAFRADDGGRTLGARLGRDITLGPPPASLLTEAKIAPDPRAFADQDPARSVDLSWPRTHDKNNYGCHVITAIISDESNFDYLDTPPFVAAQISWFVWVPDPDKPTPQTVDCFDPNRAGAPQ